MSRFHVITAALCVIAGFAGVGPAPASAHDSYKCNDGIPVKWSVSNTSMWYDPNWASTYRNGITSSITNFNVSDFAYGTASITSALVAWGDMNNSDTSIAGGSYISVYCPTHTINAGNLYYNFPHFGTGVSHGAAQYTCVAIHEMGHQIGYAHNNVSTSIMFDNNGTLGHTTRCHGTTPVTTLGSHDLTDINSRY